MKKLILIGALLLPVMLFAQESDTPFTGIVEEDGVMTLWRQGQMVEQKSLLDGKLHGLRSVWDKDGSAYQDCYDYGQSINQGQCPDLDAIEGVPDSIAQINTDKTKKRYGAIFEIGESEPFTGVVTDHDGNGQKTLEMYVLDGKPNGPHNTWHSNGQKMTESIFGNGRPRGTVLSWYENGQMRSRVTYVQGEPPNEQVWTENGIDATISLGAKEALNLMGGAKAAVREYFYDRQEFPADNATAGMSEASEITGRYVTSVVVNSGIVTAMIETSSDLGAEEYSLTVTPSTDEGGAVYWKCHSPDIETAFLPPPCR